MAWYCPLPGMVMTCRRCPPSAWKEGLFTVSVQFWYRSRTTTWESTPYRRSRHTSRVTGTVLSSTTRASLLQGVRISRPSWSNRG